jgi:hypothetical protein
MLIALIIVYLVKQLTITSNIFTSKSLNYILSSFIIKFIDILVKS